MKKLSKKKTYEALGFVESMLAIMIVGVSSVVLMQIAVNTMQNILQNESIDNITQYAIEGAEIVQEIANKHSVKSENLFPSFNDYVGHTNCFTLTKEEDGEIYFKKTGGDFDTFNKDQRGRDVYKDEAILSDDDLLFRIVCLRSSASSFDEVQNFVIAEIIVGQRYSDGSKTKGNLAKDYMYRTVIKLMGMDFLEECGDGICSHGENAENCPEDCSAICGDGFCTHDENPFNCPADCPAICGDHYCTHDETAESCPVDCLIVCADGECIFPPLTAETCPEYCPPICGDGHCTHNETFDSCPEDCKKEEEGEKEEECLPEDFCCKGVCFETLEPCEVDEDCPRCDDNRYCRNNPSINCAETGHWGCVEEI
jgi:hypothetical protein